VEIEGEKNAPGSSPHPQGEGESTEQFPLSREENEREGENEGEKNAPGSSLSHGERVRVRGNLRNRHFAIQIDILHGINQLHAIGHRLLKGFATEDQPHPARTFVDDCRTYRIG